MPCLQPVAHNRDQNPEQHVFFSWGTEDGGPAGFGVFTFPFDWKGAPGCVGVKRCVATPCAMTMGLP